MKISQEIVSLLKALEENGVPREVLCQLVALALTSVIEAGKCRLELVPKLGNATVKNTEFEEAKAGLTEDLFDRFYEERIRSICDLVPESLGERLRNLKPYHFLEFPPRW